MENKKAQTPVSHATLGPPLYRGEPIECEVPMQADSEIVRAVLYGDRQRFAALVERHERAVWATAWRVLRDEHAAADAAQEAFLQAFRRLAALRRPEHFGVWLLRIARREAVRQARRRGRERVHPLDRDEAGVAKRAIRDDERAKRLSADAEALLAAVAGLPEHERIVVAMHYLDERSAAEISSALGRPVGTVTKQLSRAIQRLRFKIEQEEVIG